MHGKWHRPQADIRDAAAASRAAPVLPAIEAVNGGIDDLQHLRRDLDQRDVQIGRIVVRIVGVQGLRALVANAGDFQTQLFHQLPAAPLERVT